VRALLPLAERVEALCADGSVAPLVSRGQGVFEGALVPASQAYRLRAWWPGSDPVTFDDPYRFGPLLGELDAWLLAEGTHLRPFELLGATPAYTKAWPAPASRSGRRMHRGSAWSVTSTTGTAGATRCGCAANAACGSCSCRPCRPGARYKFELVDAMAAAAAEGRPLCARGELRPSTASIVAPLPARVPAPPARQQANAPQRTAVASTRCTWAAGGASPRTATAG
jgi:1,4-alpha-glucan branching enzyme